jgi:competence protein ComEC
MKDRSLGHRAPLLWLLLPYLSGLAAGGAGIAAPIAALLAGASLAGGMAMSSAWRERRGWAPSIVVSLFLAGLSSYAIHVQPPPDGAGWPAREARLDLRVDRISNPSPKSRFVSGFARIAGAERHLRGLVGQEIYFSLKPRRGAAAPERSEVVTAIGLLAPVPRRAPAGSLDRSLREMGFHFRMTLGRPAGAPRPPTTYRLFCARTADRMNLLLGRGLEGRPALAALYRAMMLGRKGDLGADDERLFLQSGTMHLFAINGVHIGVVALTLQALLALARCPRAAADAGVLAVLWLDVDTTGASPSAVRAFLMIAAVLTGRVLRRPGNPVASLAAAAAVTLAVAPMDIFTASFQLSYGVVAALGTLGFPLAARLRDRFAPLRSLPEAARRPIQRVRARLQDHLLAAAGVGAAAALVGGVAGIAFFGLIAPAGLFANLILMPLAFLVIAAGVSSLLAGFAGAAVAGPPLLSAAGRLFNCAAGMILWLILALVRLVARIPGAYFPARYRAPWIGPAALGAVIAACLAGYAAGWRRDRGGFWPPFVVVAIVLVFGVIYRP